VQGGISDYIGWLTQELANLGFEMSVLTSSPLAGEVAPKPSSPSMGRWPEGPEGPTGYSIARTVEHWDRRMWRAVANEVSRFKPDILHIQYQEAMYGGEPAIGFLPWALAARGLRPAIVTTIHDMGKPRRASKLGGRLAFESLVYGSRRLTVSNDSEFRGLVRRPGIKERLSLVSVGSNIQIRPLPPQERSAVRASVSGKEDAFLIAHFGLVRPDKGLDVLIDAMAELHRRSVCVELLVIGGTADVDALAMYRDQLIERQRAHGLDEVVHFLGRQDEADVSRLLQASDLAVLPFVDGASASRTTINAALSHGLPLLSTRGPGIPARFTDGTIALIDAPPDAKALSQAIEDLSRQPERRESMARRGRELAARDSHSAIAERIATIYKEVGA
jgi:glycosyltransferase involved in cell wall biosynthesis